MGLADTSALHAYPALSRLPHHALRALDVLECAGFEAWLVGGCVRDALRGIIAEDIDIATDAIWTDVRDAFAIQGYRVYETGTDHGTVTVVKDDEACEITTYRIESGYRDRRHPDSVRFVSDITDDLARRDFTINAIAYHPRRGIIDPFGGANDLTEGVIRCVGDADRRIEEDALRIMRAIRFSSQLGFKLEERTDRAVRSRASLLGRIAGERIKKELDLLLCGEYAAKVLMGHFDVIETIMPELSAMRGFDQRSPWHIYDVLEHTAHVIESTPARPLTRWAALLHDSGKPACFFTDEKGVGHMPGHPLVSTELLRSIAARFRFPRRFTQRLDTLIRLHDEHLQPTRQCARSLYAKVGHDADLFHDLCSLIRADTLSKAACSRAKLPIIDEVERLLDEMVAEGACLSPADLPLTGRDIIALGAEEGPLVGLVLNETYAAVAAEKINANRDSCIAFARQLVAPEP